MDVTSEIRYIQNSLPIQELSSSPRNLLQTSIEALLQAHPVPEAYDTKLQKGIFSGYTSLAYLLLQVSRLYPDIAVDGSVLSQWAARYLEPIKSEPELIEMNGGLHCERLCVKALRACLSKSDEDVQLFLQDIPLFLSDEYPDELFYGRAGVLHLLRLVKTWVPDQTSKIDAAISVIVEKALASRTRTDTGVGGWTFLNKRFLGPAHGDIGILVQIVLSKPSVAPQLKSLLIELLDLQQLDGNWPKSDLLADGPNLGLVQWCHGAPGFLISLQAVRHLYPELEDRITDACEKGLEIVWEQGLSRKEPSMCHGIFGNALAVPVGSKRSHFLAHAEIQAVERARANDNTIFKSACYTAEVSALLTYLPGAVWSWAVCEMKDPPFIGFTDV